MMTIFDLSEKGNHLRQELAGCTTGEVLNTCVRFIESHPHDARFMARLLIVSCRHSGSGVTEETVYRYIESLAQSEAEKTR